MTGPSRGFERPDDVRGRGRGLWVGLTAALVLLIVGGLAALYLNVEWNAGIAGFETSEGRLFARLSPERATELVLERDGDRVVLVRGKKDDEWIMPEHDGFPASSGAVNDLLRQLSTAEVRYISTRPEPPEGASYGFGNDPPGAVAVTIRDREGATLAEAWVGRSITKHDMAFPYLIAVVRKDDPHIRLVGTTGKVDVEPSLQRWTSTFVLHILAPRIVEAEAAAPQGGAPLSVRRDEQGRLETPRGAPAPEKGDNPRQAVVEVTRALEDLRFVDVRAARSLPAGADSMGTARYRTREGLGVAIRLVRDRQGAVWSTFHVTADGGGDSAVAEAKSLRERVDGWAFQIPRQSVERMVATRSTTP